MKILGIETSCDETAAAVVEDGTRILSNVVVSQIDIHAAYGGVVPEIAARSHIEAILPVITQALKSANLTWRDIDAISVTHTPGLLGSLLIGTLTARTLAILHRKPLFAIHHLKSHIYANWLKGNEGESGQNFRPSDIGSVLKRGVHAPTSSPTAATAPCKDRSARVRSTEVRRSEVLPAFPLIALVVSGGHTQLIHMHHHNHFEIIGTTHDDAIGEVFDKIAKLLGLPYPGGPSISQAAASGNPQKYHLPHPKMPDYDFSFSGLKTAVLRAVQKELDLPISTPSTELAQKLTPQQVADFAASFQSTAINILVEKLQKAVQNYHPTSILLAGGVAANHLLRSTLTSLYGGKNKVGGQANSFKAVVEETGAEASHFGSCAATASLSAEPCDDRSEDAGPKSLTSAPVLFFPPLAFSTDNAAMVASAAFFAQQHGQTPTNPYTLDISPRSPIDT